MNSEGPVELTVVARQAGVRIAVVRRYLEFGLFEAHPEPAEAPRYDPRNAGRIIPIRRQERSTSQNSRLSCRLVGD